MATPLMLTFHLLFLVLSALYKSPHHNFYTIFTTIAQNNLLHFLHTTFIVHLLLFASYFLSNYFLGKLSASEQTIFQEKVYGMFGDLILVVSFFPSDLDMLAIIYFSFLFTIKSLAWVFEIKSQSRYSSEMLCGGIALIVICSSCALLCWKEMLRSFDINVLLGMEYILLVLSLMKVLSIMVLNIKEIEANRSFYVLIINVVYLLAKAIICAFFMVFITVSYKFPFNIAKSLLSTIMKLKKKIGLFKDYLQLCKYLDGIEEADVDGNCAICADVLERGKVLRCMHVFHSQCLKMWCEREMTCPICRAPLAFKEGGQSANDYEVLDAVPVELVN